MNDKSNPKNNVFVEEKTAIAGGKEKKNGKEWVGVTLGGVGGILMGAGLMYAQDVYANKEPEEKPVGNPNGGSPNGTTPEPTSVATQTTEVHQTTATPHMAHVGSGLSFGDAFAAARAEVGPGGVFVWHGGVYNTYTVEEWNAMSPQEHANFVSQVPVHVPASKIDNHPTDSHPDIAQYGGGRTTTESHHDNGATESLHGGHGADDDIVDIPEDIKEGFDLGSDVHIVGIGTEDGHVMVGYDGTGDGNSDFVIIDVDDDRQISEPDVVVDSHGHIATISEVIEDTDDGLAYNPPYYDDVDDGNIDNGTDDDYISNTSNDYDAASDMPDYVDDALMDV